MFGVNFKKNHDKIILQLSNLMFMCFYISMLLISFISVVRKLIKQENFKLRVDLLENGNLDLECFQTY